MTWHATLAVDHTQQANKTMAHFCRIGPLHIPQSLYLEGNSICRRVNRASNSAGKSAL